MKPAGRNGSSLDALKGRQPQHGERVAALAAFGERLYVKVLIYMYIFQDCQGCQLSVPRWLAALVGSLWGLTSAVGSNAIGPPDLDDMGPVT
jgi:hypothetical protein